jgi:hypothetical protein
LLVIHKGVPLSASIELAKDCLNELACSVEQLPLPMDSVEPVMKMVGVNRFCHADSNTANELGGYSKRIMQ